MVGELFLCLVVGITDGDTLTARCGEPGMYERVQVRVQGIDAPERKQRYGHQSRQALSALVFQRWAELRCGKTDRYQRKVCSVWVAPASAPKGPRTVDVGLAMVSTGMAWWYRAYAREQTPHERWMYESSEDEARSSGLGLWSDVDAIPPWTWRKKGQVNDSLVKVASH